MTLRKKSIVMKMIENDLKKSEVKLSKGEGLQLLRKLRSNFSIKYQIFQNIEEHTSNSILKLS